jgi:hypothetical protein
MSSIQVLFYCNIALRVALGIVTFGNARGCKMTRKTTLDLPHDLLQHAKHEAVERNTTLRALVIMALRKELGSHGYVRTKKPRPRQR